MVTAMDKMTRDRYLEALQLFGRGKQYVEIRILNTPLGGVGGILTADTAGAETLCQQLTSLDLEYCTVYQVINELSAAYVAGKALNVLVPHVKSTAKDADIQTIHYIMTDFDPKRPAKTSSKDAEKQAAYQRLILYLVDMKHAGLIPNIITDSGNGYNAYYRVNLPNTPENVKLVQDFNRICHIGYSDDLVEFDPTVTNPSRLAKLPGTWAVKGQNTSERPHRQSCILAHAPTETVTDRAVIEAYVEAHRPLLEQPRNASCAKRSSFGYGGRQTVYLPDVEGYLVSQGWRYWTKPGDKGQLYILQVCPFHPEHDNAAAFLTAFPNGRAMFRCHHTSCEGNDIHKLLAKYPAAHNALDNGGETK